MYYNEKRAKLTRIFMDTVQNYETVSELISACHESVSHQLFIGESEAIEVTEEMRNRYNNNAEIIVSQKRTLEAASAYVYNGCQTVVHNFASSFNPGGGVKHGSSAQEECLCRCSTLYYSLNSRQNWAKFYTPHRQENLSGLHNDDIIYTPFVKVFKSDTDYPELLPSQKWYNVNVITCAAPDISERHEAGIKVSSEELSDIHKRRLRKILDTALYNGNEVVVLGAFGCGAFGNPPAVVAKAAETVIADYMKSFKVIEFAVYCNPKHIENYEEFAKIIK